MLSENFRNVAIELDEMAMGVGGEVVALTLQEAVRAEITEALERQSVVKLTVPGEMPSDIDVTTNPGELAAALAKFTSIVDIWVDRCPASTTGAPVTPRIQQITDPELAELWRAVQVIKKALIYAF